MPLHILWVEDHPDGRIALSNLLDRYVYSVSTAATVAEALESLDNLRFDILLSDIGLPGGTGLDLVVEAKKRQALTSVALSAWNTDQDIAQSPSFPTFLLFHQPVLAWRGFRVARWFRASTFL